MYNKLSFGLYVSAVEPAMASQQIIQSLTENVDLSPLERYAIASQLAKAAAEAARQLSDDGISYALSPENEFQPLSGLGKQFEHNGETYQVQFVNEFNYNQGDAHGLEWQATVRQIESLEEHKKALTKQKKGLEAVILAEHPRLQPTMTKTVLKYLG